MTARTVLVLCTQAVLIQLALGQCTSRAAVAASPGISAPYRLAGAGLACGIAAPAAIQFSPTRGGALPVSSASAIAPVGISVASDNIYEGALSVAGELPFVGTVAFENVLPTAGSGAVNHACGNGVNAMISDAAAYAPVAAIAPAAIAAPCFGYLPGYAGGLGYVI